MSHIYFSHNGDLKPVAEAVIPLSNVEYAYGFGVYETIRMTNGHVYFLGQHCKRLQASAKIIGLEHTFTAQFVAESVAKLIAANKVETTNIKIMLIGGAGPADANLYIQCLNPLFPDRKLYKTGVHTITKSHERVYSHAKSLNMLPSYLGYRDAKRALAYDCLLIDRDGNITEGTRTNFYALQGQTIISPPETDILLGVTRDNVLKVAQKTGFSVVEQPIALETVARYDGVFLTSTSSKIMPIRTIDEHAWDEIPVALTQLMAAFDEFLASQAGA